MFAALVRRATPFVIGILVVITLAAAASTRRGSHTPSPAPIVTHQGGGAAGTLNVR